MKKIFLFTLMCLGISLFANAEATDISGMENVIYTEGGSCAAGSSFTMSVKMKNAVAVTGFQFDLELPSGITVAKDADGFHLIALSTERTTAAKTNYFDCAEQSDGSVRVMASSTQNFTFSGNDGEVVTVKINVGNSVVDGTYPIIIKNIVLSDVLSNPYEVDVVEAQLTVEDETIAYDEGYAVKALPFTINTSNESTDFNVFINSLTNITSLSFDLSFSSSDFVEKNLIEHKALIEGRGTSASITTNANTYHISTSKSGGISDLTNIAKFTIYSQDEAGTYTLPDGVYTVQIDNIEMSDGTNNYKVAPYKVNIFVGSPKAVVENGVIALAGDYSDSDMANVMLAAIPTEDTSVMTVNLTGITSLPAGTTITCANPNALIKTSKNLALTNTKNVIIGKTCANLVLTDGYNFSAPNTFTATSASYTRTMGTTWGTVCLPYEVQSNDDVAYYQIEGIQDNVLVLAQCATLPANTPALMKKLSGDAVVCSASNVAVGGAMNETPGTVTMHGSYANDTRVEDANAYYIKNDKFWLNNGHFFIDAFRAYFTANNAGGAKSLSIEGLATGINALTNSDNGVADIWDANGVRRNSVDKGMNVVKMNDGKCVKIFVKLKR